MVENKQNALQKEITVTYLRSLGCGKELTDKYREEGILYYDKDGSLATFDSPVIDLYSIPLIVSYDLNNSKYLHHISMDWFEIEFALNDDSFMKQVAESIGYKSVGLFYWVSYYIERISYLLDEEEDDEYSQNIVEIIRYLNNNLPESIDDNEIGLKYQKYIGVVSEEPIALAMVWQSILKELFFSKDALFRGKGIKSVVLNKETGLTDKITVNLKFCDGIDGQHVEVTSVNNPNTTELSEEEIQDIIDSSFDREKASELVRFILKQPIKDESNFEIMEDDIVSGAMRLCEPVVIMEDPTEIKGVNSSRLFSFSYEVESLDSREIKKAIYSTVGQYEDWISETYSYVQNYGNNDYNYRHKLIFSIFLHTPDGDWVSTYSTFIVDLEDNSHKINLGYYYRKSVIGDDLWGLYHSGPYQIKGLNDYQTKEYHLSQMFMSIA